MGVKQIKPNEYLKHHETHSESGKTHKIQKKFKMSDNTITSGKCVFAENSNDFFVNIGNNLGKRIPNVTTQRWTRKYITIVKN